MSPQLKRIADDGAAREVRCESLPDWQYRHLAITAAQEKRIACLETMVERLCEKLDQSRKRAPRGYVPAKTAAADVSVSYQSVLSWAERGYIDAIKRGGNWYISMESLKAYDAMSPAERKKARRVDQT